MFHRNQLLGRSLRIDHVEKYKLPKKLLEAEEAKGALDVGAGHAYKDVELKNRYSVHQGQDLFAPASDPSDDNGEALREKKRRKKEKKKDSRRKHDRKKRKHQQRQGDSFGGSDEDREALPQKERSRDRGESPRKHTKRRHTTSRDVD